MGLENEPLTDLLENIPKKFQFYLKNCRNIFLKEMTV